MPTNEMLELPREVAGLGDLYGQLAELLGRAAGRLGRAEELADEEEVVVVAALLVALGRELEPGQEQVQLRVGRQAGAGGGGGGRGGRER